MINHGERKEENNFMVSVVFFPEPEDVGELGIHSSKSQV